MIKRHLACQVDGHTIQQALEKALEGACDGELFLEDRLDESVVLDQGVVRACSRVASGGFGLRGVYDPFVAYAQGTRLDEPALAHAVSHLAAGGRDGQVGNVASRALTSAAFSQTPSVFYPQDVGVTEADLSDKVAVLNHIDIYARQKDSRVVQVQASLSSSFQRVAIHRIGSTPIFDDRPMSNFRVSIVMAVNGRQGVGTSGAGGRYEIARFTSLSGVQAMVDEAMRLAALSLEARPAPAGDFPIVLGPGWTGILLHEAVGHGLEGDSNRRKTSKFHGLMGEMVASPLVSVVDDGTMENARGSLHVDDEGTPTQATTLIEGGRLVGYMQDRMNGRMMGSSSTGNCRRESYASLPLVRMTNTFMRPGPHTQEEMIQSVKRGIFAVQFGGGEVDISSGNFVFTPTEAYMIEDGRVTFPMKGATLVGNGADTLKKITRVGQDFSLDPGLGSCGKDGQSVPVGVGQPSILISSMTVGGTQV